MLKFEKTIGLISEKGFVWSIIYTQLSTVYSHKSIYISINLLNPLRHVLSILIKTEMLL